MGLKVARIRALVVGMGGELGVRIVTVGVGGATVGAGGDTKRISTLTAPKVSRTSHPHPTNI